MRAEQGKEKTIATNIQVSLLARDVATEIETEGNMTKAYNPVSN